MVGTILSATPPLCAAQAGMNLGVIPWWLSPTTPHRGKVTRAAVMGGQGEQWAGGIYLAVGAAAFIRSVAAAHHPVVFNFSMGGQGDNAARSHLTCW